MPKRPSLIPTQKLNLCLSLPLYTRITSELFSDLEGRVPLGEYQRFFTQLLNEYWESESLDVGEAAGSAPGTLLVRGSPEAIGMLRALLSRSHP